MWDTLVRLVITIPFTWGCTSTIVEMFFKKIVKIKFRLDVNIWELCAYVKVEIHTSSLFKTKKIGIK